MSIKVKLLLFSLFFNNLFLVAQNSLHLSNLNTSSIKSNAVDWKEPKFELGLGAVLKHHYGFAAPRIQIGTTNLLIKNRFGFYYILEYRPNIEFPEDNTNYYLRDILGLNFSINKSFTVHSGLGFFQRGILYSGNYRGGERFYGGLQIGKLRKEIGVTYNFPTQPIFLDLSYSGWVGPTFTLGFRPAFNSKIKDWHFNLSEKRNFKLENESNPLRVEKSDTLNKLELGKIAPPRNNNSIENSKNSSNIENQIDTITQDQNKGVKLAKRSNSKSKHKSGKDIIISSATNFHLDSVQENTPSRIEKYKLYKFSKNGNNVKITSSFWGSKRKVTLPDFQSARELEKRCILYYPVDIDTINNAQKDTLNQLISYLNRNSENRLIVFGNTDNSGTSDYNFHLSEARAKKVKLYLTTRGIAEKRVEIRINGETKALGESELEKARNRCVEFQIVFP